MRSLVGALGLDRDGLVSLVGGGGKTTLMYRLTKELRRRGVRAAAGTTTKIQPPEEGRLVTGDERALEAALRAWPWKEPSFPVLGRRLLDHQKVDGVDPGWAGRTVRHGWVHALVLEADGAARRPLKAPEAWEPVVPEATTLFVAVVGLSCLGRPLSEEWAFRLHRVCEVTGARPGETIDPDLLVRLLLAPDGLAKGRPAGARAVAVLNQADDPGTERAGREVARAVMRAGGGYERVVLVRLRDPHRPVRGVWM